MHLNDAFPFSSDGTSDVSGWRAVLSSVKERNLGVRFNSDTPSILDLETALTGGSNIPYRLLSRPLYMIGQVRRLVREGAIE